MADSTSPHVSLVACKWPNGQASKISCGKVVRSIRRVRADHRDHGSSSGEGDDADNLGETQYSKKVCLLARNAEEIRKVLMPS